MVYVIFSLCVTVADYTKGWFTFKGCHFDFLKWCWSGCDAKTVAHAISVVRR